MVVIIVAGLLVGNGVTPQLYPVGKNIQETSYHLNAGDLRKQAFNSSTDLLPLMQELLDYSGTIAVTLRKDDIESASHDLSRYASRYHDLQNLVIRLDMNESEIAHFSEDTGKQKDLLSQFVSSSESLKSLEKLEIQYHDENDPDSVTRVRLQGRALKNRIQTLQNQYADVTDSLSARGGSLGVDTSPVRQSRTELDHLTGMVAERQSERDRYTRFAKAGTPFISFLPAQVNVTFQDKVEMYGFISGSQEEYFPVEISIDNVPFLKIVPDEIGEFRSSFKVHNISAGDHVLKARWGTAYSEPSMIHVTPLETKLALKVLPVKGMAAVNLTWLLNARDPVPAVPVTIYQNDQVYDTVLTSQAGTCLVMVPIPEGTFDLFVRSEDPAYPLTPSESQHYTVISDGIQITSVTSSNTSPFQPVMLIIPAILLFAIPAIYFWRKGIVGTRANGFLEESPNNMESNVPVTGQNIPWSWNGDMSISAEAFTEPDGSPRWLYLDLLRVLSGSQGIVISPVMTPREISESIQEDECRTGFTRFITWYERVRYGGCTRPVCTKAMAEAAAMVRGLCKGRKDEI